VACGHHYGLGVAAQPAATPFPFFFFNLFKIIIIFFSLIYLYLFINSDTCQQLIGADMVPNEICQKKS